MLKVGQCGKSMGQGTQQLAMSLLSRRPEVGATSQSLGSKGAQARKNLVMFLREAGHIGMCEPTADVWQA